MPYEPYEETTVIRQSPNLLSFTPEEVERVLSSRFITQPTRVSVSSYDPSIESFVYTGECSVDTSTSVRVYGCGNSKCPNKERCEMYIKGFYNINDENTCEYFEK